jgi:broad specificity phosphatase PhoE
VLVRHATTDATRRGVFPADEELEPAGEEAARALAGRLGDGEALCSTAERSRATAAAAGLDARVDPALDECDFGAWRGRTLPEVQALDPDGVAAWMTDPVACPHGGEALGAFAGRVGAWLDEQATLAGGAVAVTHGGVIRAAVVHALGAPHTAVWRIDAAPLHATELRAHDGRWTLKRVNAPVVA